jgi:hypothetical protein
MAVLYSRVIHSLKTDDEPESPTQEDGEKMVMESLKSLRQEVVSQVTAAMSQYIGERLKEAETGQATELARSRDDQAKLIAETGETVLAKLMQAQATLYETENVIYRQPHDPLKCALFPTRPRATKQTSMRLTR